MHQQTPNRGLGSELQLEVGVHRLGIVSAVDGKTSRVNNAGHASQKFRFMRKQDARNNTQLAQSSRGVTTFTQW